MGMANNNQPKGSEQYVYRVLRNDESYTQGIQAKDPRATIPLGRHVEQGSRNWQRSQYISTCLSLRAAMRFASNSYFFPRVIVRIKIGADLNVIDLTNPDEFKKYSFDNSGRAKRLVKEYEEFIIIGEVPSKYVELCVIYK